MRGMYAVRKSPGGAPWVVARVGGCAACGAVAPSALAGGGRSQHFLHRQHLAGNRAGGQLHDVRRRADEHVVAGIGPRIGGVHAAARLPGDHAHHCRRAPADTCYVLFNIVVLDHVNVTPGSTLHVSVRATAPSRCNSHFDRWLTVANTGGRFGSAPAPGHLPQQPDHRRHLRHRRPSSSSSASRTDSSVNQSISPSSDRADSSTRTRGLVDSSAPVTLALGNDPGLGTLGGTVTVNAVHGVATFNNLSIDQPGVGYTLTASSPGLTGDTSNSFNESQTTTTTCTTNPCTTDVGTSTSDLQISADPAAGSITESVDVGTPLDCSDEDNGGYTGFDANWYGFSETGTVDKTLSYEIFGLNSDQIRLVHACFGAPYEFTTDGGGQARPSTLPDGSEGFVGVLPTCDATDGVGPCVESIEPFTDGHSGLLVTVDVPGIARDRRAGRPLDARITTNRVRAAHLRPSLTPSPAMASADARSSAEPRISSRSRSSRGIGAVERGHHVDRRGDVVLRSAVARRLQRVPAARASPPLSRRAERTRCRPCASAAVAAGRSPSSSRLAISSARNGSPPNASASAMKA